ncbi:MAG TPA: SpoIIE family protein phosphatase [Acidimicrobiales bacterium]|nr:SpoIIE family protein phosphatase [Acidimicrobiales bacterium]
MDELGGGEGASHDAGRSARRAPTTLFTLALIALVVGTTGGALVARERALEAVDDRAQRTAETVAAVLDVELRQVAARMGGAGAVVGADGELEPGTFAAFASDAVGVERPGPMVLLDIVTADERSAFEARTGSPILVVDEGGPAPAPPSDVYYPVVAVAGAAPGRSIVGVDFGAEPVRRAAIEQALETEEPAVSGMLVLASTGGRGIAAVRAVADEEGTVRGFVSTAIPAASLEALVAGAVETSSDVGLLDGDEVLVGRDGRVEDLDQRQVAPVPVPGRDWRVAVLPGGSPDFTVTWLVAAAGLVATLTMASLLVLTVRHHGRLSRANALLARNDERSRAVQGVAGRLARALTGGEVASALVDHLPAAVGARSAVVAIMDRSGRLELLQPGSGPRLLPPPEVGTIVEQVLSLRDPALLQSPLGWRGDEVAGVLAGDASSLAVLPLLTEDVVGVLAVGYPHFHIFGEDEQALLQTVAVLAGQALSRGRRYDAEHQAAVAFQRAALPDALPSIPGLSVAARYRPAVHGATVGGDWYDALPLGDDRVLFVVGDVVGHGMTAAAAMGRLRTAFQTIVPYSADPGSMLQGISQQIDSIPDAFCTTVVSATIDARNRTMTWSRAGHPPPLVVSPGQGHVLLDEPCLPPLGVAPEQTAPVHVHQLREGDVVVLYTDGIVERREESLDQGFRRLAAVAEELVDLDVDELADALVEAMVPEDTQADDLAVLVVRVETSASGG